MGLRDGIERLASKAHHPLRRGLARGLDLILPPESFDGRPVQGPGYGADAWMRIAFIESPVCDGCGAPFPYDPGRLEQTIPARCLACTTRPRAFARARAACVYDLQAREMILKLKHGDRPDIGKLFARWLSRAAADLVGEADVVAPVPLHPRRLFARRYNQAAEIARPLARMVRKPYRPDLLVRSRATPTQGGKSGRSRRVNVQGAFTVPDGRRALVAGLRVLLVDDVLTTGATAEACARALLQEGAAAVDLAVVAKVQDALDGPI